MSESISSIVADSLDVRRRYFAEQAEEVARVALMISDAFIAGGKLLLFDNGSAMASNI